MENLSQKIFSCKKCDGLNLSGTLSSIGYGDISSKVIFYGSSFGGDGLSRAIPFGSGSGRIMDKLLEMADVKKEEIYISNVVKCRLPDLRSPKRYELDNCRIHLLEELDAVKPEIIVPMGAIATRIFLGDKIRFEEMVYGEYDFKGMKLIPMFHPSYIMRGLGDKERYFNKMIELIRYAKG